MFAKSQSHVSTINFMLTNNQTMIDWNNVWYMIQTFQEIIASRAWLNQNDGIKFLNYHSQKLTYLKNVGDQYVFS